ncbi:MAG: serine/threonine protein kinase [Alphaproteobacteria bacterium]|jgi:serine/threonine protein kinase
MVTPTKSSSATHPPLQTLSPQTRPSTPVRLRIDTSKEPKHLGRGAFGSVVAYDNISTGKKPSIAVKIPHYTRDNNSILGEFVIRKTIQKLLNIPVNQKHLNPQLPIVLAWDCTLSTKTFTTNTSPPYPKCIMTMPELEGSILDLNINLKNVANFTHFTNTTKKLAALGVILRDLRDANIFLDAQNNAYIGDMGVFRFKENTPAFYASQKIIHKKQRLIQQHNGITQEAIQNMITLGKTEDVF